MVTKDWILRVVVVFLVDATSRWSFRGFMDIFGIREAYCIHGSIVNFQKPLYKFFKIGANRYQLYLLQDSDDV
jgi:hypothetical protein